MNKDRDLFNMANMPGITGTLYSGIPSYNTTLVSGTTWSGLFSWEWIALLFTSLLRAQCESLVRWREACPNEFVQAGNLFNTSRCSRQIPRKGLRYLAQHETINNEF
jgi:hypothetical protein